MLNFETKCRVKFCIDKCRLMYREKNYLLQSFKTGISEFLIFLGNEAGSFNGLS